MIESAPQVGLPLAVHDHHLGQLFERHPLLTFRPALVMGKINFHPIVAFAHHPDNFVASAQNRSYRVELHGAAYFSPNTWRAMTRR
jgi:hypothetical protein